MSNVHTLTVTLPDGTMAIRTTARGYKFVGAVKEAKGWRAVRWSETRDGAESECRAHGARRAVEFCSVEISTGTIRLGHVEPVAKPVKAATAPKAAPAPKTVKPCSSRDVAALAAMPERFRAVDVPSDPMFTRWLDNGLVVRTREVWDEKDVGGIPWAVYRRA